MKKTIGIVIMILCIIGTIGCSKEEIVIEIGDVSSDTLLIQADGKIKLAIIEDFDKSFYNITELKEFILKEITNYNQGIGKIVVNLVDLKEQKGQVTMVMEFLDMDQYAAFQEVTSKQFLLDEASAENLNDMPDSFINMKKKKTVSKDEVISNNKLKVAIINEAYDVIIDGKIMFYSEGTKIINQNKIQSSEGIATIILYK